MKLHVLAIVCALIVSLSTDRRSHAQERFLDGTSGPVTAPTDEGFIKLLTERKRGIVVIDAAKCHYGFITVGRLVDTQPIRLGLNQYGGIGGLLPGQYSVLSVKCGPGGGSTFRGPFATFSVGAGEMVDVGVLQLAPKMDYLGLTGTGTLHKSIVSTGAETLARLKEKLPRSFARMIRRPMTLVGPADVAIKRGDLRGPRLPAPSAVSSCCAMTVTAPRGG